MKNPKVTIAIPAYNNERVIEQTIRSAMQQEYPDREILVIDDASTDKTVDIVRQFPDVRLIVNEENMGIGLNLAKLMNEARGKYVVYLCGDDLFANNKVVSDIVNQFNKGDQAIGVIGRFYYFFMDGHPGAIGVCRERNILIQSCCPSGMAFKKDDVFGTNKIFVEMPHIVAQYLKKWRWTMMEYDTVAARFHPGGNTGTKKEYYKESPTQNWIDLLGPGFNDFPMFIQLKNRAPHLLWNEIMVHLKNNKKCLMEERFWFYALTALIVPGFILRPFTNLYRHRITRNNVQILKRVQI